MTDLFDSFSESGALTLLLDSKDSKSCIREQLIKIGKSSRQIIPLHLYKLAAKAIPSTWARDKMTDYLNKNQQNLEKICWKPICGPLIVSTIFYGYFKYVLHQRDFNIYTFSVLAALRILHVIPFISNLKIRGHVLYTFVTGVINGKKPHMAIQNALANRNLHELIFYHFEDNRNNRNNKTKRNYAFKTSSGQKYSYNTYRSKPQFINCRNCHQQLENNINFIRNHNNNYCKPQN